MSKQIPNLTTIEGLVALDKILRENPSTNYVIIGVLDDTKVQTRTLMTIHEFMEGEKEALEKWNKLDNDGDLDGLFKTIPRWMPKYGNLRHSSGVNEAINALAKYKSGIETARLSISLSELAKFTDLFITPKPNKDKNMQDEHDRIMFGESTAEERLAYINKFLGMRRPKAQEAGADLPDQEK